jgi:adenine/guanine phosphoribosyltransferase-like PRPP-binding protein
VRRMGGEVLAAVFLIELQALGGRARLDPIRVESVLSY